MIPVDFLNDNAVTLPEYFSMEDLFKVHWLTHEPYGYFAGSDNPKSFKRLLKKMPDDWHYRNKEIYYAVNSRGYRTYEFDKVNWKEAIVLFGCSMVAGVGVADDETISYYLEQLSGRPVVNLGVPGSGLDFNLYNNFLLKRNYPTPYAVVNIYSNLNRMVCFQNNQPEMHGLWSLEDGYVGYMQHSENPVVRSLLNCEQVKHLWKDTRTYYATWFHDTSEYIGVDKLEFTNTARDLAHCGLESNKANAQLIYTQIKAS